jgi:hypothetical protein
MLGEAGPPVGKDCTTRPLSDFLNAQGTLNDPPQFFPPVKDYVGWVDAVDPDTELPTTFALVDYAGLANEYITAQTGISLGTEVTGSVLECELADGRAEITVVLSTTKALGFAQSIADLAANDFNFLITPTIFGAKAQDVVSGVAAAATGPASLFTTFSISAPGAPLPDFLDVVNNWVDYAPVTLNFTSTTIGMCPNRGRAVLRIHQMASTNDQNELIYSQEMVEVVGSCGP